MILGLFNGFLSIMDPVILTYLMGGILLGVVIGILPALGGLNGLAILMPLVFGMEPTRAFALLLGMYSISPMAGAATAILMNIPGDSPNSATLLDGFPMTEQGHAGRALGAAFTSSSLGGLVGALTLALSIPIFRPIVMAFGSPESLMLVLMGISSVAVLGVSSPLKGLIAAGLGFIVSFIGYQAVSGFARYTFDIPYFFDGLDVVPMALGLFAMPEVIDLITTGESIAKVRVSTPTTTDLWEGVKDVFRHWGLFIRACVIGLIIGIAPGVGATAAAWMGYAQAKQTSKNPEKFGTGCIEGVIAPEAAHGADHGGGMIPTLAFAVPGSGSMAILLGILVILGIQPGPFLIRDHADLVFSMVAIMMVSYIVGAIILICGSAQLAKVAFIRGHIMGPSILILVAIGAYCVDGSLLDVFTTFAIGGIAYLMRHLDYSRPAVFLGFLLGGLAERYFYLSLGAYRWSFFFLPIPFTIIVITVIMLSFEKVYGWIKSRF